MTAALDGLLGDGDAGAEDGESLAAMLQAPARHSPPRWPASSLRTRAVGRDPPGDLAARSSPAKTSWPRKSGRSTSGSAESVRRQRKRRRSPVRTSSRSGSRPTATGCRGLVLMAKSTYVWLDQLSRRYGRDIRTLDAIPDEELDVMARRGITGLWLIGLWQRARASEKIKRWRGNQEAVASAYSLDDYRIADDLGGDAAHATSATRGRARHPARERHGPEPHGHRLALGDRPSRPVHLGPGATVPGAHTFGGENLADDDRVEIRIEDHYWNDSDAAVVFERRDRATGERRYVYHGNDGTSFPWNDTAQLDFLRGTSGRR